MVQFVFVCKCMKSINTNPFKANINENIFGQVPVNLFQFLIERGNREVFYLLCIRFPYFKVNYLGECSSQNVFPSAFFHVLKVKYFGDVHPEVVSFIFTSF